MINPYQAVDFGTYPAGRHFIRGLYAYPLYRGLYVDKCYDIGRVENVHFWPFWGYSGDNDPVGRFVTENAEAFVIGRTDWEYITNSFAIFYKVGFHFIKTDAGSPNALLTQSGSDISPCAVLVDDCQSHAGVSFLNSQLFGRITLRGTNTGPVRFTGCGFFGATRENPFQEPIHAAIAGSGHVAFDNCHFITLDPSNKGRIAIRAAAGSLSVIGCQFMDIGRTHVLLEDGLSTAVVQGNTFRGKAEIVNECSGNAQISGNADVTPPVEPGAVVVDDSQDNGKAFTTEGEWSVGRGGQDYADVAHWAKKGSGECKACWRPDLPKAGIYAVYIWYSADPMNDHATDAPFAVHHRDGTKEIRINLKENAGKWNLLGEFRFKKGNSGFVTTTNGANGNVLADAVKFVEKRNRK